jgi:hypothetical protein
VADKNSATLDSMKNENLNPADAKLGALLRESRGSPPLPPRFQENVWRRIEDAAAPVESGSWLEAFVAVLLRPRFALAVAGVLLLTGVLAGTWDGRQLARHDAEMNYVASVVPVFAR